MQSIFISNIDSKEKEGPTKYIKNTQSAPNTQRMKNKIAKLTEKLQEIQTELDKVITELQDLSIKEEVTKLDIQQAFTLADKPIAVGDRVRTSRGRYKCRTGTVTDDNKNSDALSVRLDTGQVTWRKRHNLKKL